MNARGAHSTQPLRARSTNAGGRETRQLLIRTAERLFAERGIGAVSLRQISLAAGMRMSGSVAYHFGDKNGLIAEIIAYRSRRIDDRCLPRLEELEQQGRLDDLRAVTEAAIRSAVEELGETDYYFRFLAQLDRDPQTILALQARTAFLSGAGLVIEVQDEAARRHLPPKLVKHRRRLATHLVFAALADLEADAEHGVDEDFVSDLVECVVGLYLTPVSDQTLAAAPPGRRRGRLDR
jgi:AcrR family transcriptional regulator